jgi:nitrate/nitrite transporter NarK
MISICSPIGGCLLKWLWTADAAWVVHRIVAPAAAAVGIALISSFGNLGPAVAPTVNGLITQGTGSTVYSMVLVIALYLMAGALLLFVTARSAKVNARRVAPAA